MLEIGKYLVIAAAVFIFTAFFLELAIVSRVNRTGAAAERASRVKVSVGSEAPADEPRSPVSPVSPYESVTARRRGTRGGMAWYATAFVVLALAMVTFYLVVRAIETGHGPFANQHEFAISFVWGILVAHLLFVARFRLRVLALVVMPIAALLLVYGMNLDTSVRPLVPALHNDLMLTTHVIFAVLGYGAACVAFASAVLWLVHPKLRKIPHMPKRDVLDEVGYRAAVFTFPLLTIMIALGSYWANVAWGRFWGWDPKETASLVTWLLYGAYLHARVAHGWNGKRAAWLLVIAFAAVLFTYFGNHFLGGLHSYA